MRIHTALLAATAILTLGGGGLLAPRAMAEDKVPQPMHAGPQPLGASSSSKDASSASTPKKDAHAGANDWPQWRGPNHDGVVTNSPKLLDAWPAGGPPLEWTSDFIPGGFNGGMGSVVVADGRAYVYVNTYRPKNPKGKTVLTAKALAELAAGPDALSADEIAKLSAWKDQEFPYYYQVAEEPSPYPASINFEVLKGDKNKIRTWLAIYDLLDVVVCLDAATGKTIWTKEFPGRFKTCRYGGWTLHWANCSTPAVAGDCVYAQGTAGLYCLSTKDGAVRWQAQTLPSNASPLVANGAVYVASGTRDQGFYTSAEGGALTAYDAKTGQVLWSQPKIQGGSGHSVVPWASGGKNYIIGGGIACLDAGTGAVVWQVDEGNVESSTVAIRGDTAVFCCDPGACAYQLTPQGGKLLWKLPPSGWPGNYDRACSPVIGKDAAYISTGWNGQFECLDLKTGAMKWAIKGVHYSSPLLVDGKIIYPGGEGWGGGMPRVFRDTSEKYDELGQIPAKVEGGKMSFCSSPSIAGGKLYLRCPKGVACFDLRAR